MREQLAQRLKSLKTELDTGEKMLADLDARRANLRETLLRISGAIQVLEEMLAVEKSPEIGNSAETHREPEGATQ